MKSIVVEEQEQEEGSESKSGTGFVDLDQDTLLNVLKRVDAVTLGRAECVNKLWCNVARDERLWEPIALRFWASICGHESIDGFRNVTRVLGFRRIVPSKILLAMTKPPPSDFYSIDPQVFSKQVRPWV